MKSNTFNYSLLAVGVAAVMGISTGANAAKPATATANATVDIDNFASATYKVGTDTQQQTATSNTVRVTVSETSSFIFKATSVDLDATDDLNKDLAINPQSNQTVVFNHTLQNKGNVTDKYTLAIVQANNDNFDYSTNVITYTTSLNNAVKTYVAADGIVLASEETANIIITSTSNTQRKVGDNGAFTVTASSKYLQDKAGSTAATYQASNTDNAITKTPIYAITKSANTNLNNNNFDTANDNAYIDYKIIIKNEGNADAKAFDIVDVLPTGLIALTTTTPTSVVTGSTSGTASTAVTPTFSGTNNNTITVTGQNLTQGETITITFRAVKDTSVATIASGSSLTNVATVRDDTLSDVNANTPDLIDKSDTVSGGTGENNYEDPNAIADKDGKDDNSDATVTTRNQVRSIIISAGTNKEVPLISSGNVYSYIITNNGKDITEATKAGEVLFTVLPTTDNTKVTIVDVYFDSNNDGVYDATDTKLNTTGVDGTYDLYDAVKNAVPANNGLSVNEAVKIFVKVNTAGVAGLGVAGDISTSEIMTVSVLPKTAIDGTPAPANANTTSETTMEGIILAKEQVIAACSGVTASGLNYDKNLISGTDAKPGACIYYKITAKSTFKEAANSVKTVAITDTFDIKKVRYNANLTSTTSNSSALATSSYTSPTLVATFATLKAAETGTVYFSTTISETGATP